MDSQNNVQNQSNDDQVAQLCLMFFYVIYSGSVVHSLQESIGNVSNNLVLAYKKMSENMESSMKLMSNMNTMMESFVLLHVDLIPTIVRISETEYTLSICIKNNTNFLLKQIQVKVQPSNDLKDASNSLLFKPDNATPLNSYTSLSVDIEGNQSKSVQVSIVNPSSCYLDITLLLPSPGTGHIISKVQQHAITFLSCKV